MNISQANSLPLSALLSKLGSHPAKERPNALYYLSPWRDERTASFHVSISKNVWYDHGEGIGGDTVAFGCTYLEKAGKSYSVSDALSWLDGIIGGGFTAVPIVKSFPVETESPLRLKKLGSIRLISLIRYLEKRGIPLKIAKQILQEAWVHNKETGRSFYSLALANEDEGYELRNPIFKGCLRPKTISFIRGSEPKPESLHIFEGSMDYLSILSRQQGKALEGDTIILNSLSCLKHAFAYIKNYGYRITYTWFDNDAAGQRARQVCAAFLKTEQVLEHLPMNAIYAPHKDVNEWHVAKLGL